MSAKPGDTPARRLDDVEITRGFAAGMLEMHRAALADDRLPSVRADLHDAAACIRRPERDVRLRQNAFRPLQIVSDECDRACVDLEVENRVAPQAVGSIDSLWRVKVRRLSKSIVQKLS